MVRQGLTVTAVGLGADVEVLERGERLGANSCSWYAGGMLAPWCERETAEPLVAELEGGVVGFAYGAPHHERAAYLMEKALPSVRRERQDALLMRWLGALSDEAVRRSSARSGRPC